jgi:GH18 family chitinase
MIASAFVPQAPYSTGTDTMAHARRVLVESLESRLFLSAAELVRNGGFEGTVAASDWARTGAFQADSRFTNVHSGSGYAYFADANGNPANNLTGALAQTFTVPSTASSLTLSYWTRITTSETTTTLKNDLMTVTATDGTTTQTVGSFSNLDKNSAYAQQQFFLDRTFIGKTVTLTFTASTDAALATVFRVDDVSLNSVSPASGKKVVGYLPDYRYSSLSKIDTTAVTHINYFSISITTAGVVNSPSSTFLSHLDTAVDTFHAAGVTVSITVGPANFKTVSSTQAGRDAFAANVTAFAMAHNLDGVDIDWEPPAGNPYADYGLLIDSFYAQTQPKHMLLTAAVNPWTNEIPVAQVNNKMSWLNVMCYDFGYADVANYTQSISGLTDWRDYGVTKSKIVMGLPFYGRYGTSWSDTHSKSYPTILTDYGTTTGNTGKYPAPDLESYADNAGNLTYFNGVDLIRKKTQYVVDNSYGGMMIWELGMDWYTGTGKYDQRSLLPAIKGTLYGSPSIGTITPTPADNSKAPVNGTQSISVTVTGTAASNGVLCLTLVGRDATLSQSWVQVPAGAYNKTFTLSATDATVGTRGYELYAQFRAGASTGPFSIVDPTDQIKVQPFHLDWQTFPAIAATPTPADGALLTSKPTTLDWGDSASATSYDVYLDGLFKANVTTSQWSTTGVTISPNVSHTWQINAKNSNGTTTGPIWDFSYNDAPNTPENSSPANNAGNVAINPTLSASAFSDPDAGDTHAASQWILRRVSDNAVVIDSGTDTTNKTSRAVAALDYSTAYSWQVRYQDNHGAWSNYSTATAFTTQSPPDNIPPTLADGAHDNDTQTISATASEAINNTTGHAFITIDGGSPVDIGSGSVNGLTVTYTLPSALANGNYTLTIPAGSITDTAGNGLASDYTLPFFIFAGDVNHDRVVNITDFNFLASNFGKSGMLFSQGNLDRSPDGAVTITDFNILAAGFGKSLDAPAAPASFATEPRVITSSPTGPTKQVSQNQSLLDDVGLL